MSLPRIPVGERFWQKVEKTEGCWEWTAAIRAGGYGAVWIGGRRGRHVPAHRVAYELTRGPIPAGLNVLHRCDNRRCVNPDHLFLGDHTANMRDMVAKQRSTRGRERPGRRATGDRNPNSKLTPAAAEEIRRRYAHGGVSLKQLADLYGVSKRTILNVIHYRIWV